MSFSHCIDSCLILGNFPLFFVDFEISVRANPLFYFLRGEYSAFNFVFGLAMSFSYRIDSCLILGHFPLFSVDLKSRWEPIHFSISREVNIPIFNSGFGLALRFLHCIDSCLECDAWKFPTLFGWLEISMRANSLFSISREVNIPLFTDNINLPQSGFTLVWAQIPEESQREENILHHLNFVKRSILWATGKKVFDCNFPHSKW